MYDEKQLDALADRMRNASPETPARESIDRVHGVARSGTVRRSGSSSSARTLAAAAALLVLGISLAVATGGSGEAFAREDALAALYPSNGDVVHLVTTGYMYNEGEPVPTEEQREIEESWVDYSGGRARSAWLSAKTGEKSGELIAVDGMWWRVGDNYETPEPDRILQESPARNRPGSLDAYEYLKEALPDGDVVGEVVRDGERYWDIRWRNKTDRYGLKFSARAILRKSDYRPALIEHSYPGGAQSRWEVIEWSVIASENVKADLFDPASLSEPDLPEIHAWFESDLAEKTSSPVYSAGDAVGSHGLFDYEEGQSTYVRYVRFDQPADLVLGRDRIAAEYMEGDTGRIAVSVSTNGPVSADDLKASLASLKPTDASEVAVELGTATVAGLPDGSSIAVLSLPHATIAVHSSDRELVLEALRGLKRVL